MWVGTGRFNAIFPSLGVVKSILHNGDVLIFTISLLEILFHTEEAFRENFAQRNN